MSNAVSEITLTATEAANLLNISGQWLRKMVDAGYVEKSSRGRYPLVSTVQGFVRYLKDEERRTSKVQADTGLKAARQREVELRIAEKEGRLVEMSDVEGAFSHILGIFRTEIDAVPSSVTRDRDLRAEIERGLNGAFTKCESRFLEASVALRAGRDPVGTEADNDA